MLPMLLTILLAGAPAADADIIALDKQVYDVLKDLNNRGADLHNSGDSVAAYRMYQGGLVVLKPLLGHRPVAQKVIDDGMKAAESKPMMNRAVALHTTITELRGLFKPGVTQLHNPMPVNKPDEKSNPPAPKSFPNSPGSPVVPMTVLWDRLGGEKKVEKIVDDWMAAALPDAKVDLTRGGLLKLDGEELGKCKRRLIGYVSNQSQGTVPFAGKTLIDAHLGIPTTGEGFTAFVGHLKKALTDNGVTSADIDALVKKVEEVK